MDFTESSVLLLLLGFLGGFWPGSTATFFTSFGLCRLHWHILATHIVLLVGYSVTALLKATVFLTVCLTTYLEDPSQAGLELSAGR